MGMAITVPDSVFKDLNRLERKIMGLGTITNNISGNIVAAFKRMADGVDPFLSKVESAESALKNIGNVDFSKSFASVGKYSGNVEKAASSMVDMANTMNRVDFSTNIERADRRLKELVSDLKVYEDFLNTPNTKNQIIATEGIEQASKEIRGLIAAIPELEKLQSILNRNDLFQNYIDGLNGATLESRRQKEEMEQLNGYYRELEKSSAKAAREQERAAAQAAKAAEKQARELAKLQEQQRKAYLQTPTGALESADNARTYAQRAQAMRNLEAAIKSLDSTEQDYQKTLNQLSARYKQLKAEQDKVTQSLNGMRESQHHLMDTSGQLMRALALMFSVSQIQQYVTTLARVRGEFELQNAALASILQNKDEADRLFGQITELAVQSPFQLKELVTYTKELAAYRIENEKLYDTTKMLADVSAGLGVDMSRLILAYGQVKAANYLRGTELRQFSEAGINILGELATYFSEIENRAVSVGEVFNMVSNRMVRFQDVEEVFHRLTSEGGMFANMQEVQSRTLAGMISNMRDSVEIMLNDIGQANDGPLKASVNLVRRLMENWRTIAALAPTILTPLIGYNTIMFAINNRQKVFNSLLKIRNAFQATFTALIKGSTVAQRTFNIAANSSPYLLVGSIIIGVLTTVISLIRNATREQREMNATINEGVQNARELSSNFERLADIATDTASSAEEQKNAIEELNRSYGELIPSQNLTSEGLKELKGDYHAVTSAIYDKIEAQTKEKLAQEAQNNASNKINNAYDSIVNGLQKYNISSNAALTITRELQTRIENGLVRSAEHARAELGNIAVEFTGEERYRNLSRVNNNFDGLFENVKRLYNRVSDLEEKLQDIDNMSIELFRKGGGTGLYESLSEELRKISGTTEDWRKKIEQDESLNLKFTIEIDEAAKDARIKEIQSFIDEVNMLIETGTYSDIQRASAENVIADAKKEIEKIRVSDQIDQINDLRVAISRLYNVDLGKLSITEMLPTSSFDEYTKSLSDYVDNMKETIDLFAEAKDKGETIPLMQQDSLIGVGNTIENYTNTYNALVTLLDRLIYRPEKDNQSDNRDKMISELNRQIDAIKRASKAYQDALKLYNETDAASKIRRDYTSLFTEVGLGDMIGTMEFDAGGIISALESLIKTASEKAGKAGSVAVEKAITDYKGEINVEVRTQGIENVGDLFDDLMSGYNIALQLDETGLDKDAIAQMFGIDETSISGIRKKVGQAWIDAANEQERVLAQMEGRAAITYTNVAAAVASLGEEGTKAFQSQVDAMDKAIANEQKKWMDMFIDYLANSVDEIKQVQNKGAVGISFAKQFFDEGKLSAEQYGTVIKNIIQDTNKEISKLNLEKFKDSPEYIQAMGNLAAYSAGELQILLDKLRKFIAESSGNIDASDMEAYMNAIERVEEQIDKLRSPWENNPFSEYSRLVALEKEFNAAQENHNRLLEEQAIRQQTVLLYEQKLAELKQRQQNGEDVGAEIWATDADLISATENLENANKQVKVSQANLGNISGEIENITDGASIGLVKVQKIVDGITQSVEIATVLFDEIKGIADSFGADTDEGAWKEASLIMGSIGDFASGASQSVTKFMSGDIFGGIISAVQTVGGLVKNINAIHDNRREQIIINETEKVEDLERAYKNLRDRMDEISSASQANELKESLERNYDQQIESYKRMIAAEQDKKDSDNEQIKEYQQAIEDLENRQAEDLESILTTAGGMAKSEYLSAADEFVDSWLSAFQETGDGLSGLEGNFNEFFLDVLKRQAALQIASKWTDQIADSVNAALKDDSALTTDEGRKIIEDAMAQLPGLNEALKNFFAAYSDIVQDAETAEGSLSGLQKGIQGVTEETAQVLEALLNSMRYYVADSNLQLRNIYMLLSGNEAVPNPMLAELRTQTEQIRAINKLIRNVTASGHPKGGDGIKIFMN